MPSYGECKVYIGGLPPDATSEEIESAFKRYGHVRKVWVARRPPGFAFVYFDFFDEALRSVRLLQGERICGVRARVELSHGRGGGGGGGGHGRGGGGHGRGGGGHGRGGGGHGRGGGGHGRGGGGRGGYGGGGRGDDSGHLSTIAEEELSLVPILTESLIEEANSHDIENLEANRSLPMKTAGEEERTLKRYPGFVNLVENEHKYEEVRPLSDKTRRRISRMMLLSRRVASETIAPAPESGSGMALPTDTQQALDAQNADIPAIATQCFMLSNMFDPSNENEPGRAEDVKQDVIEECSKNGGALHVYVDQASVQGNVYVKCPSVSVAYKSVNSLHGRWFSGKVITANYVPVNSYHDLFPDARHTSIPLVPASQSGVRTAPPPPAPIPPPPPGFIPPQFRY